VTDASDPAIGWLLSSKDPSIRFLTLTEVLGRSMRSREVREARDRITDGPRIRALLKGQRRDGGFGVHPYAKWTGGFWRLISLVDLAIPSDHPGARLAVGHVLDWVESPVHRRSIKTIAGRVRQHACHEGFMLAVCSRLGLAREARVRSLRDSLLMAQWPDGGWNCDPDPDASHSSFHETFAPLWGLHEYARTSGDPEAAAAADRAAEFFLRHGLFRSESTGLVVDPGWLRLRYPSYWHYDVLQGLLVLSRAGRVTDHRARDALDVLQDKRRRHGCWQAEGYWWRPPGSRGSNVEVVDWGRAGPNEMITLTALRVLRAAGRLDL
jgi:hypothetical protein